MGRILEGGSTGAGTPATLSYLLAGQPLASDDLVQIGTDGKVYPVGNGNVGKVTEVGAAVFPETTIHSALCNVAGWRPAALKHSNGDIYTAGSTGCTVKRYSPLGALKQTNTVDQSLSNYNQWRIAELSNGSIVVTWFAANNIYYAVVDQSLKVVKAFTEGSYHQNRDAQYGLCALSGGGFAISWSHYGTSAVRFRVFNNIGTATIADTQWGTTATSDPAASAISQLSDGNLCLVRSGSTGGVNTKYAVFTPSGVQVKAETQLSTLSAPDQPFIIEPGDGYFCLRIGGPSSGMFYIFDNAGVQQGAVFGPITDGGTKNPASVLWDGADFYVVYGTNGTSGTLIRLVKLPVTGGAGAATFDTYVTTTAATTSAIDAYWEGNNIAVIALPYNANQKPSYGVVGKTGVTVTAPIEFGSLPGTTQGNCVRGFHSGDAFTFGAAWEQLSPQAMKVMVVKSASTAIFGVAQAAASAGEVAQIAAGAGTYRVNPIGLSTTPSAFDHSTGSTVPGNKGTLLTHSVILRGI